MKNVLMASVALAFAIGATDAIADERRGGDRGRGPDRSFDRGYDRGFSSPGFNTNRWRGRNDRDRVSFNININDRWHPAYRPWGWNSFGYNVGFRSWGTGLSVWSGTYPVYRRQQPVVVYQNTWIDTGPRSTTVPVVINGGTSLLRDINGRCFERSYDRLGNETRVELPTSACNF